jgi:protoporphyrinogen oxidase
MNRIIIIGGGMAGLGAAWELRQRSGGQPNEVELYEREDRPGGLCRTEHVDGFHFDYTGHALHLCGDVFRDVVFGLVGNQLEQRDRKSQIFSKGVYTDYPFQANLHGLPPEIVVDCIYEYAREWFSEKKRPVRTYEDWILAHFGQGIADHFMIPYNAKLYRRHPRELSPDAGGRFVPRSDLKLLLEGAIASPTGNLGYNASFYYPRAGGIETLIQSLAALVGGARVNEAIVKVRPSDRTVITSDGKIVTYDGLISTQPLPELIRAVEDAPAEVRAAADRLTHVSVLNINYGVRGDLGDTHWVYVPEKDYSFYRIGFPNSFASSMSPPGHSSIYTEVSYDPEEGIDVEQAKTRCIEDLLRMNVLEDRDQVASVKVIDIPYAYVVFDQVRSDALQVINGFLDQAGIISAGRFGSWDYYSMEDSFMSGKNAGAMAAERLS